MQIMPIEDAKTYRFDPFDVTKVWSQKDYPLIEVGRMVLDRNPENYFAEVEQVTFSPALSFLVLKLRRINCYKAVCSLMVMHTATGLALTITVYLSTVQK